MRNISVNNFSFVLAGVAVFERSAHWVEQAINQVAARFSPENSYAFEMNGSPMLSGPSGARE